MCGVIGIYLQKPSVEDFELIKRVFVESKIRGLHATGISYINSFGEIDTIKRSIPADKFVDRYFKSSNSFTNPFGDICLIGHCRYSTSDLEYNQPLSSKTKSIVHNGVISQELPEKWESLYGLYCETKNDSELILKSDNPLKQFNHMSMSVISIETNNKMYFYRNGKRPIYLSKIKNGFVITSTKDIAFRSGILAQKVLMDNYYIIDETFNIKTEKVDVKNIDLQREWII